MLNKKLLGSVSSLPSDANFENVTLLLSGDGTNGAQNNTFLDSSTNNFTITRNGNTTQGSFSPYGSNWSNYFNGSSGLTIPYNSNWILDANFTIEGWIFPTGTGTSRAIIGTADSGGNSGWDVQWTSTNTISARWINTGSTVYTVASSALSANTWHHFAFTLSGTTLTLYVNGTSVATTTVSGSALTTNYTLGIGQFGAYTGGQQFIGYISNARYVKGSVVYTGNFTPPTAPLTAITNTKLLTCQSNRFIDNSSNAYALTVVSAPQVQRFSPFNPTAPYDTATIGGSGYFDGSGDYLTLGGQTAFAFGTGDWTVSFWLYLTTASGNQTIFDTRPSGTSDSTNYMILQSSGGSLNYYTSGAGTSIDGADLSANTWYWVELSKVSGNTRLFVNGSQSGSTYSDSQNYVVGTNRPIIANDGNNSSTPVSGYIGDFRIVKGSGITSSTVPTSPISVITNTSLLAKMTNAGIPDLAMMNNLETVGNAQVSTSVKKYGTGSLAFDGTGDYLISQSNPAFDIGGSTHCIEMWMYSNSWSSGEGNCFVCLGTNSTTNSGQLRQNGSNQIQYYLGSIDLSTSSVPSTGSWSHVVATYDKTAGRARIFIDGVLKATQSVSNSASGSLVASLGVELNSLKRNYFNGYLDDVRITRGVIPTLYQTSSTTIDATIFTPPASALPTY